MYVVVSFLRKLLKHYSRAGDVQDQTHHQELARCGGHQWAQCHYCIPSWQEKWTVNVNKWARSGIWTSLVEALKHLEIYTHNIYIYIYILQSITIAHTHIDTTVNVAKTPLDCSTVSWRARLRLNKFAPQQKEHRGNFSARSETSNQKGTVFHKSSVRPQPDGNYARTQLSLMPSL